MAETPDTLRPLSARDRRELSQESDEDILQVARQRFTQAEEWEREERDQQYEALRFSSGQHWPEWLLRQRSMPGQEQPSLTIDRTTQYHNQVINSYRRNPLGVRVRPKSSGASQQVATVLEGKVRDIEADSQAELAYTSALSQAISTGEGFFRLALEYEDHYSFRQKLVIQPLYNRFAVYCDPASTHPAALDLEWCFIVDMMTHSNFCAKYQVQPVDVGQWAMYPQQDWVTKDQIRVAEYWYKTWERLEIVQMPDGTILPTKDIGEIPPEWPTRETLIPTVYGCKMCGYAILEKTRWPSSFLPLIRVEGRRLDLDGKARRTGIVQASSSSQLAYDAYASAEMSAIALAPKAPYVLYVEQISGYEAIWNQANDAHVPYLPIKAVTSGGTLLPPPRREVVEPAVQAITQARLMAAQDIQATIGQYEASVGAPSNEQSGAAIDARKREGEQTTAGFTANLAWSIEACGRQILDILPKLYLGATELRQVGKDGTVSMAKVNQPLPDGQQHDLATGVYECVVSSGPSYDTSREMFSERLGILLGAVPDVAKYVMDLYAGSLDIPAADELAARLKTMVPPEALAATEGGNAETKLVQAQNAQRQAEKAVQMLEAALQKSKQTEQVAVQQATLLEQEVARKNAQLADKRRDVEIDTYRAKWEHEEAVQANQIKLEELRLKYGLQAAELQHEMSQPPAANGTMDED